jgi:putative nucleotidyltransferase with HDIG domain
MPTRDDAWQLVCEWTRSDSLRKHMLAVEAAVRAYARRLGGDEELWGIAGLVHDLDYERYPDLETGHPRHGVEELRQRGYPDEVIQAVLGHADFMGVPRETRLDKALFACDELAGFIAACAYVRPEGINGMKPKSVKKKLKQPSFAAGVDRDDVYRGAAELEPETGMSFDEHLQFVIDALAEHAEELGLTGRREEAATSE